MRGSDSRQRASRGFSLVEVVVSIVVLSGGLSLILLPMITATRGSADPIAAKQSLAVAESLMDEILSKDFANPSGGFSGAATQANRPLFDDVSDYDGFSLTGVQTVDGIAVSALSAYTVSVTVAVATAATIGIATVADVKIVTVSVGGPGQSASLTGYRANY